jgi:SOS-response transcriptional repressor LexA
VRLEAPSLSSPFSPGRDVTFARLSGRLLEPAGLRDGDHVALERRDRAREGDLASVVGGDGLAALWRVVPRGSVLLLSAGDGSGARRAGRPARVQGVVVGVLRKFRDAG